MTSAKDELGSFTATPKHSCHARGCSKSVPPRMLMCGFHWRIVPAKLQADVWRTYRRGQEIDKSPSREYLDAARAAIEAVATRENEQKEPERPATTTRAQRSTLHGVTLHRPWSWAIAHNTKRVENRAWEPTIAVGSYLAIHAGKTWDEDGSITIALLTRCMPTDEHDHPTGIVAVARLARVIDCSREDVPESQEPWTVGPYAWLLDNVLALDEPVQCSGARGLWPIEGALLERVRRAWARAARTRPATGGEP